MKGALNVLDKKYENQILKSLDAVIEFKRSVYEQALNELVRFVDFDRKAARQKRLGGASLDAEASASHED